MEGLMRRIGVAAVNSILALVAASAALAQPSRLSYPPTATVDVKDVYHGVEVADPYRWLEQDVRESKEVAAWVEAESSVTLPYLASLPERAPIKARLEALWSYERYTVPTRAGGRYFFRKNDGLQAQSVLYLKDSLVDAPRALIDPNSWSTDGTVALTGTAPNDDGRWLAYGVAEAGSDWQVWHVLDVDTGKVLPDEVRWVKFSSVVWTPDSRGFSYGRYPAPAPGATFQAVNLNMKVYYHRIGAAQSEDVLVYERPDHPEWTFAQEVTEDGRYLVITASKGTDARHTVFVRDLAEPLAGVVHLVGEFEAEYSLVGNHGPLMYFLTNLDAPRGRLVGIDVGSPARSAWTEVIKESAATLQGVTHVGHMFVARYLEDARSVVRVMSREGRPVRAVALPGIGTASGFEGRSDDSEVLYSFASFTTPPTVYRYDVATGATTELFGSKVAFDPTRYEVKQVFVTSKDGTRVPMFLTLRKGLKLDGSNPTLLYGYGGFNASMTPSFSASRLVWLEMGGVYASVNLRGGGEYGEAWHRAGTKLAKQNVFDDCIAAAEWLIANRYTSAARLAVQGGSNGGLLVGAVMTQRPDLFGVALPAVGVMDMLRFHKFTAGRFWVDDFGSSENAEEFKALYAYSPYHNLKKGVRYPATLVTTADHDDRVVPGHSFKFAAALQADQAGPAPVLIRIESRAGHGAGKPTAKLIEETADQYAFAAHNLGVKLPAVLGAK
jgi:prolyl oligopeptidase